LKIAFSRQSLIDLAFIQRYGELKFGLQAALEYQLKIQDSIDLLKDFPLLAHESKDLKGNRRALVCGSHLIIYRALEGRVEITRVVSGRQDLTRIF
jgi:plasmid stabilization system protein ParE